MMQTINWKKVSFDDELSELKRTVEHYTSEKGKDRRQALESNLKYLRGEYSASIPTILSSAIWKKLGNTDSWGMTTLSDVNLAIAKNASTSGMRDATSIVSEFMSGSVRCPIILQTNDGYTLIGGNTRLMIAKVLNITPKCIIIKTDW